MVDHTPVRKKGKARALRASQVHPGQKCTQCTLCNENANSYVHSVNWRPSEVSLLHQLAPDVAGTDCIYVVPVVKTLNDVFSLVNTPQDG